MTENDYEWIAKSSQSFAKDVFAMKPEARYVSVLVIGGEDADTVTTVCRDKGAIVAIPLKDQALIAAAHLHAAGVIGETFEKNMEDIRNELAGIVGKAKAAAAAQDPGAPPHGAGIGE